MKKLQETLGNRLQLLEAAAHAFSSAGYKGASLRAIAKRAGVSFQLIQHHFGTKQDLWQAVVEYLYSGLVVPDELLRFDPRSDLRAQFHDHLRRMMISTLERSNLRKIAFMEQFEGSDRYHDYLKPRAEEFLSTRVRPYFEQAVGHGILPGWTADEAAILWASVVTKNIADPDFVEFFSGHPVGTMKSIDQQVDLMFRVFTSELARPGELLDVGKEPAEDEPKRVVQADETNVVYPIGFQRTDGKEEELRFENRRLKQLVGELTLENRYLSERIKEIGRRKDKGSQK